MIFDRVRSECSGFYTITFSSARRYCCWQRVHEESTWMRDVRVPKTSVIIADILKRYKLIPCSLVLQSPARDEGRFSTACGQNAADFTRLRSPLLGGIAADKEFTRSPRGRVSKASVIIADILKRYKLIPCSLDLQSPGRDEGRLWTACDQNAADFTRLRSPLLGGIAAGKEFTRSPRGRVPKASAIAADILKRYKLIPCSLVLQSPGCDEGRLWTACDQNAAGFK